MMVFMRPLLEQVKADPRRDRLWPPLRPVNDLAKHRAVETEGLGFVFVCICWEVHSVMALGVAAAS